MFRIHPLIAVQFDDQISVSARSSTAQRTKDAPLNEMKLDGMGARTHRRLRKMTAETIVTTGKSAGQCETIIKLLRRSEGLAGDSERTLRCVRDGRTDKVQSVNRGSNSKERKFLALYRGIPQRLRAGPDQHRSSPIAVGRQRKSEFDGRARLHLDGRVKVDAGAGNVPQLRSV